MSPLYICLNWPGRKMQIVNLNKNVLKVTRLKSSLEGQFSKPYVTEQAQKKNLYSMKQVFFPNIKDMLNYVRPHISEKSGE